MADRQSKEKRYEYGQPEIGPPVSLFLDEYEELERTGRLEKRPYLVYKRAEYPVPTLDLLEEPNQESLLA